MYSVYNLNFTISDCTDNIRRRKRRELTLEQKQEIVEAFDLFDTDKDQEISYYEFKVFLSIFN